MTESSDSGWTLRPTRLRTRFPITTARRLAAFRDTDNGSRTKGRTTERDATLLPKRYHLLNQHDGWQILKLETRLYWHISYIFLPYWFLLYFPGALVGLTLSVPDISLVF